uniref:MgtC/SapB/SrpB/YhiD N-terminal domain-containing protein n=1 Tax=Timspurckia oligopyrenoides TaxID=708627 RepID=A0A7S1EP97_9RHOD|mmetsp:Transcript_10182/g.18335  ORF Transcript_10182/g.18335 Transcript_10182/m.18335 type:complete len:427 (+) Transcript_10182:126-1406(+)
MSCGTMEFCGGVDGYVGVAFVSSSSFISGLNSKKRFMCKERSMKFETSKILWMKLERCRSSFKSEMKQMKTDRFTPFLKKVATAILCTLALCIPHSTLHAAPFPRNLTREAVVGAFVDSSSSEMHVKSAMQNRYSRSSDQSPSSVIAESATQEKIRSKAEHIQRLNALNLNSSIQLSQIPELRKAGVSVEPSQTVTTDQTSSVKSLSEHSDSHRSNTMERGQESRLDRFSPVLTVGEQLLLSKRLFWAALCGMIIGAERRFAGSSAGIRTLCLVSMGSAIFCLVSAFGFSSDGSARMAANVASGVGFLGAGCIDPRPDKEFHRGGLTSAASIWLAAAIGVVNAAGLHVLGLAFSVLCVLILRCKLHALMVSGEESEVSGIGSNMEFAESKVEPSKSNTDWTAKANPKTRKSEKRNSNAFQISGIRH